MKKSELFKLAQIAVIKDDSLCSEVKLEILKTLMEKEFIERIFEDNEEKEGEA